MSTSLLSCYCNKLQQQLQHSKTYLRHSLSIQGTILCLQTDEIKLVPFAIRWSSIRGRSKTVRVVHTVMKHGEGIHTYLGESVRHQFIPETITSCCSAGNLAKPNDSNWESHQQWQVQARIGYSTLNREGQKHHTQSHQWSQVLVLHNNIICTTVTHVCQITLMFHSNSITMAEVTLPSSNWHH